MHVSLKGGAQWMAFPNVLRVASHPIRRSDSTGSVQCGYSLRLLFASIPVALFYLPSEDFQDGQRDPYRHPACASF